MLETFRNELLHFIVSLGLAIAFVPQLGILVSFLIIFVFGFFLDADHLFDYWLYLKKHNKKFKIKGFFSGKHFAITHKAYVLLHSWELVVLLWIPYLYFGEIAFWAASLSLLAHLLVDQFTNDVSVLTYFFSYRMFSSFRHLC